MKKWIFVLIMIMILLDGCSSVKTSLNTPKNNASKQNIKNTLIKKDSKLHMVGLIQLQDKNKSVDDLQPGTFLIFNSKRMNELKQALLKADEIKRPNNDRAYKVKSQVYIKLENGELINLAYFEDADWIIGRYNGQEKGKYFKLPPTLGDIIEKELDNPTFKKEDVIFYKGYPYVRISLAALKKPQELQEIGKFDSHIFYIKKDSKFPIDKIYFRVGNEESNGYLSYYAYGGVHLF